MTSDGKFRKHEHIIKSRDFREVYKKGLSVKNGPIVMSYAPNILTHNRLGFSINSRNTKQASDRNRARRIFREVYRKHKPEIRKGFDLVIIVKRPLPENIGYADAEKIFLRLVSSAGLSE